VKLVKYPCYRNWGSRKENIKVFEVLTLIMVFEVLTLIMVFEVLTLIIKLQKNNGPRALKLNHAKYLRSSLLAFREEQFPRFTTM
jgi:hypothetical protein